MLSPAMDATVSRWEITETATARAASTRHMGGAGVTPVGGVAATAVRDVTMAHGGGGERNMSKILAPASYPPSFSRSGSKGMQ